MSADNAWGRGAVFIRHYLIKKFEGEGASPASIFFDIRYYTSSHWPDR